MDTTNTKTDFGLSEIGQIAIVAHDIIEMTGFYRDKLGMRLLFEMPNMAFFDCGGVRLMLSLPSSIDVDHPASIIYFKVNDINRAYEILGQRGVAFDRAPQIEARLEKRFLWLAFFRDPESNILALMSEEENQ